MDSEDQLVQRINKALGSAVGIPQAGGPFKGGIETRGPKIRLGIGDDAAVIDVAGRTSLVLSCDAFLEDVHFWAAVHPPDSVGYKALARATSDLAAMGASPRFFLFTLALPGKRTGKWLNQFLGGMRRASRELKILAIGGDTTNYPKVAMSITVVGDIEPGLEVKRSGAHPGDILYVSGRLGRAELGLKLIQEGLGRRRSYRSLLQPHLYPQIRLKLGQWLAEHKIASAMMDLSDGLSTDLTRLCAASGVGARLWLESLQQVAVDIPRGKISRNLKTNALRMALDGGDDYELLFAVPRRLLKRLQAGPEFRDLTAIGEATRRREILVIGSDGKATPLKPQGWDAFRSRKRDS